MLKAIEKLYVKRDTKLFINVLYCILMIKIKFNVMNVKMVISPLEYLACLIKYAKMNKILK